MVLFEQQRKALQLLRVVLSFAGLPGERIDVLTAVKPGSPGERCEPAPHAFALSLRLDLARLLLLAIPCGRRDADGILA